MTHAFSYRLLIIFLLFSISSCRHVQTISRPPIDGLESSIFKKEMGLVFIPEKKRLSPHVIVDKTDYYAVSGSTPFKIEMVVNPLMRNVTYVARVEKNGTVVREYVAKKSLTAQISEKRTLWTPTRSKLAIMVPYLEKDEIIVVHTRYEWMDIRWLQPLFLQEDGITREAKVTVDVPFGVSLHFKAAKDRAPFSFVPESTPYEKSDWVQEDNRAGLGMRYVWESNFEMQSRGQNRGDWLQLHLAFDTPSHNETAQRFDNWGQVSTYFYNRIDRYDLPSTEIREFTSKEIIDKGNDTQKLQAIFYFLRTSVEKRAVLGSFQDQEVQPATRTFARRYGTPFDIAILGKAMLSSVGFNAELVAVSDKRINPEITDFYSPALFSSVLLAVTTNERTYYFDPETNQVMDQLEPNRQGQPALLIRPKNGLHFTLPFDSAHKNQKIVSYQLWMTPDGMLDGDYSIDLIGYESLSLTSKSDEELRAMSPQTMEEQLFGEHAPFTIESFEYTRAVTALGIRISGMIKPKMMRKNHQGQIEYRLDRVIEPSYAAIRDLQQKGFSSTSRISLFMTLPEEFAVGSLPHGVSIYSDGVEGRFSASFIRGQLVVEGIATVSLPVKTSALETIKNDLNNLKVFGEQDLVIHDAVATSGAAHGEQIRPSPPTN